MESGLELLEENKETLSFVTVEELKELNLDLLKNIDKKDQKNIENLIKILRKKKISKELLKETLVGKSLSKIVSQKEIFPKALVELAQNTVVIWKSQIDLESKKAKEKISSVVSTVESKEEELKLPYIPKDIMNCIQQIFERTKERQHKFFCEKLIETI